MLSPDRLASLVDAMPYGVALLADGRYVYVNRAWADHLGRPASGHLGREILDDLHEGDRPTLAAWLEDPDQDGRAHGAEFRFLRPDGDVIALEIHPMPQGRKNDVVTHAFVSRDITNLRKLQARLLLADRTMSVGALSAGVAHEINNPLSYVIGNLGFIAESFEELLVNVSPEDRAELRDALSEAREGAERVSKIVGNLLSFSRPDQDAEGLVDVEQAIETAIAMAWPEIRPRARLVKKLEPVPPVKVRSSRLAQVILNLLLNAAHAIPEGKAREHEIRLSTHLDDKNRVVLELRDTGPGIPPELLGHVFDTFFTTKPIGVGTGLGLSIAHSIVKEMGGTITVESELGEGATFRVILPAARDERDDDVDEIFETGDITTEDPRAKILIVDDEPYIATALCRALKEHGLRVASSGTEAIEVLEDRAVVPDLILCDLIMPDRTGMDVFRWIKEERPELASRVAFMTGGPFAPRAVEFLAKIDNTRIEKPFDVNAIRTFVKSWMRAKMADD